PLERMHLDVAQEHLLRRSIELHRQDRGMERLVLERMLKGIVVELDGLWRSGASIHDARRTPGPAQAAARAATLGGSREGGEFIGHGLRLLCLRPSLERSSLARRPRWRQSGAENAWDPRYR